MLSYGVIIEHIFWVDNPTADGFSRCHDDDDFADIDISIGAGLISWADTLIPPNETYELSLACASLKVLPDDKEWAQEQLKDPSLYPIIRWLKNGDLPEDKYKATDTLKASESYVLVGDDQVLCIKNKSSINSLSFKVKRVIPVLLRHCVVAYFHAHGS